MAELRRSDLRNVIDLVHVMGSSDHGEPFPLPVVAELQRLVDADVAGYVETGVGGGCGGRDVVTRLSPPGLFDTLGEIGHEDPTDVVHCRHRDEPVAISDFLSQRAFQRRRIYELVCEPLGVTDSLRVYLPVANGSSRFFFFDRNRRGFSARARLLLETLRPHLIQVADRWSSASGPSVTLLTRRELEVLRLVGTGATNAQVAQRLWVTEHTVRKHLENVYRKLGVHTRTAAVAHARLKP